jgi:hypothetical protein
MLGRRVSPLPDIKSVSYRCAIGGYRSASDFGRLRTSTDGRFESRSGRLHIPCNCGVKIPFLAGQGPTVSSALKLNTISQCLSESIRRRLCKTLD